jgi:hypothetical protein
MGTELLAGRDFDENDRPGSEGVAIVTQTFAKKYLAGGNPVGRFIVLPRQDSNAIAQRFRIVGLVRDSKYAELREDFQPIVFLPHAQDEGPRPHAAFVIRTDLPISALREPLTRAIGGSSPDVAMDFRLLRDIVRDSLVRDRLMASLSAFFGFMAAVLAVVGLYGVVSFMVVRRKNEIGVRMALGATRRDILALVLREAGTLLAAGIAIGIVLAVGAATFARSLLFGLKPTDPATIALASAALAVVAIAASLLPARRAATLDPVTALRED